MRCLDCVRHDNLRLSKIGCKNIKYSVTYQIFTSDRAIVPMSLSTPEHTC